VGNAKRAGHGQSPAGRESAPFPKNRLGRISHTTNRWTAIRELKRLADAVLAVLTSLGLRVVAQGES